MISAFDADAVEETQKVLDEGGVVVVPTDTVYGLASRYDRPEAIEKIFAIKGRPKDKPLPVLVASITEAAQIGRLSAESLRETRTGWPGPMTIVVPTIQDLSFLGGDGKTVAIRLPDHEFLARVLMGGPLAMTSANISGNEQGPTIDDVLKELKEEVDLYVDGGPCNAPVSSIISFVNERTQLR